MHSPSSFFNMSRYRAHRGIQGDVLEQLAKISKRSSNQHIVVGRERPRLIPQVPGSVGDDQEFAQAQRPPAVSIDPAPKIANVHQASFVWVMVGGLTPDASTYAKM